MKSLKIVKNIKKSNKTNKNKLKDYDPSDKLENRHNYLRKAAVLLGPDRLVKDLSKLSQKETNNSKTFTNICKDKIWVQKNYTIKNKNLKKSKRSKRCRRGAIV